jgi:glycosyltransferase involved in cell wall biosynthesis
MTTIEPIAFSIVTPSFKQPGWLRLCAASIADQRGPGIEFEHIVQDALSGPEVAEALRPYPNARLYTEKDDGMYDAINRGWSKARGDIFCWLNCDEQYLPGTLDAAATYFRAHPETDVLFADAIIVDADGGYLCSRQVLSPHLYHTMTCHLQTFSCATFFRASLIRERGFHLDPRWKVAGDADLIIRMMQARVKMHALGRYLATFVDNESNLGLSPAARDEHWKRSAEAPKFAQALTPLWILLHRLRRWAHGHYRPDPLSYEIYTPASPDRRVHVEVPHPTFYWAARMK